MTVSTPFFTRLAATARTAIVCATLAATALCMPTTASAQPETKVVRFLGVPSVASMVVWIARDRGHFAAEGIDLQVRADRAAGLVTDSILSGQVDMVYGGVTTLILPYAKGAPLVSIATTDYQTTWEVLVHPDSGYQKLEDLKGKTVAVIAANTTCVLALRRAFERNNWPKDFLKFTVVSPPDQVAAFGAKRVDASCMFDPFRLQMRKQFGGRAIWNTAMASVGNNVGGNLVVSRDFADKNPKTVAGIQRAIGKAADDATANPEFIYAALAAALKQDIAAVREMALPKYASPPSLPNDVREVAEALHHFGFVDKPIDVKGFDRSVLAIAK